MNNTEATKIARDRWLSTLKIGDDVRTTYGDGAPKGRIVKLIDRDYGYVRTSGLGKDGTQPTYWIGENWIEPPEGLLALEVARSKAFLDLILVDLERLAPPLDMCPTELAYIIPDLVRLVKAAIGEVGPPKEDEKMELAVNYKCDPDGIRDLFATIAVMPNHD